MVELLGQMLCGCSLYRSSTSKKNLEGGSDRPRSTQALQRTTKPAGGSETSSSAVKWKRSLFRKPSSTNSFMGASSGLQGNQEPRTPSRSTSSGAALFFFCSASATFSDILWIPTCSAKYSSCVLKNWRW